MSFRRDIDYISNSYRYLIYENMSPEAALSKVPKDVLEKFKKGVEELAKKAVEGDESAIAMLTDPKKAEEILRQSEQQQGQQTGKEEAEEYNDEPVTEAFERFRANLGSKISGTDPIEARYELFLSDVNGHLWEIDKDSRSLNVEPKEVNEFIRNIITIEPNVDKKGKLLQKIGYLVGQTVGAGMFASLFAVATMYFAPMIGVYGLTAKLIAAALAGGGKTLTLIKNNQLSTGEKIGEIVRVASIAFALTYVAGGATGFGGTEPPPVPSSLDPTDAIIKDWPELSKTVFGQRTGVGDVLRGVSKMDESALQQIITTLKQQGLDWSQLSMAEKAEIFNPIIKGLR